MQDKCKKRAGKFMRKAIERQENTGKFMNKALTNNEKDMKRQENA